MALPHLASARMFEHSSSVAAADVLARAEGVRIAVVCSMLEENWISMNVTSDMLLEFLPREAPESVELRRIRPPMHRRFTFHPRLQTKKRLFNADRLLNRYWDFPRYLRKLRDGFDLFHIVDHSYAQLANVLPAGRCIVTCHDLDAFRSLIAPDPSRHRAIHRAMARRQLEGLQRAAAVVCDSGAVRDEIVTHSLLPESRLSVIPLGVHPTCSPFPNVEAEHCAAALLGPLREDAPEILHVSSTVPRKRIDLLLEIFARVRLHFPKARLIRVGGPFSADQETHVRRLALEESICVLPFISRETLAAVYRRAALVLHPSQAEGFGLPLVEALACGAPVAASDLRVFREVGGDAVTYLPVGDVSLWSEQVCRLLAERLDAPSVAAERRNAGLRQAARFTWPEFAAKTAELYREVLAGATRE
jgi:glycosyltransferase involved in cell wall biosynthesis